jgi:hypothetical protein
VQAKSRAPDELTVQLQKLLKPALRALDWLLPAHAPPDAAVEALLAAVLERREQLDAAQRHAQQLLTTIASR